MDQQTHLDSAGATQDAAKPSEAGKSCRACQSQFQPRRAWQHFCSPKCRNAWHTSMTPEAMRRDLDALAARVAALEAK